MEPDTVFAKRSVSLTSASVAYIDEGAGPPLLLLHGCPFSSHIWRKTICDLKSHFRCIAPDLLGLGDTETKPDSAAPAPGPKMHRRQALLMGAAFVAGTAVGRAQEQQSTHSLISWARFQIPLPIPPVLRPTRTDAEADYYEIRPAALQCAFSGFDRWGGIRAVTQILALAANLWSLVGVTGTELERRHAG